MRAICDNPGNARCPAQAYRNRRNLPRSSLPVLAEDQKPPPAQQAYTPRLNNIMILTQLGHFKLWYAGAVQNWPLANYELEQIRASIRIAKSLYPDSDKSNMDTMRPAAEDLDKAIKGERCGQFHERVWQTHHRLQRLSRSHRLRFYKRSGCRVLSPTSHVAVQRRIVPGQVTVFARSRQRERAVPLQPERNELSAI